MRIAIGPFHDSDLEREIGKTAARYVSSVADADGLIWLDVRQTDALRACLDEAPDLRWVQVNSSGVDRIFREGLLNPEIIWTRARSPHGKTVAEHALTLSLCCLRRIKVRSRATRWEPTAGETLFRKRVTIIGAGAVASELALLLAPFDVDITVVRKSDVAFPGAARTFTIADVDRAVRNAEVIFVALPLTSETRHVLNADVFAAMESTPWIINVSRGGHVNTDDLVAAISAGRISGAGLDVVDPEPLPEDHVLWQFDNVLITPHTASTYEMVKPWFYELVADNIDALLHGRPCDGLVDVERGY